MSVTSTANLTNFHVVKSNVGVDTSFFNAFEIICDTLVAEHIDAPTGSKLDLEGYVGINVDAALQGVTTIAGAPGTAQTVYIGGNDAVTTSAGWGANTGVKTVNIGTALAANVVTIGSTTGAAKTLINALTRPVILTSVRTALVPADSGSVIVIDSAAPAITFSGAMVAGNFFDFICGTAAGRVSTISTGGTTPASTLIGGISAIDDTKTDAISFVAVAGNNTITTAIVTFLGGSTIRLTCLSSSVMLVNGNFLTSTVLGASPFSTV